MPLCKVTVRIKDVDSGISESFSWRRAYPTIEAARNDGKRQAAEVKDGLPHAKVSVSVNEL